MGLSRLLVLLPLAGCYFDQSGVAADGVVPDADPNVPDADPSAPDAPPTAPDADPTMPDAMPFECTTWDALNIGDPCDAMFGTPGTITLSAGRNRYDTDTGVLTAMGGATSTPPSVLFDPASGPEARVLVLDTLVVSSGTALVASGSRPLIIVVHGDVSIVGTIDVSATVNPDDGSSTPGAGGDDATECADGFGEPGTDSTGAGGAGGGGGGGFGEDGGDGGDGNGSGAGGKGPKGAKSGSDTLVPLRGGCAGGVGGDSVGVLDNGGRAGNGGGAVEITALGMIVVSGTISANGTGGAAGATLVNAGGGGAGSGGGILLDGDVVTVSDVAKLCANGGGGGEGGQTGTANPEDGDDAACVEGPRANGGDAINGGGDGGDGGSLATRSGTNAQNGSGGGAGGGGGASVGRIRVHGRTTRTVNANAIVSPDATM